MTSKAPLAKAKSRKTLSAANLEQLGAARLAEVLIEVSDGQPALKRRLRMELAARIGPEALAAEIEKPIESLKAARHRVNWRKLRGLRDELGQLRAMINGPLAQADKGAAILLLLRFLSLERGLLARLKDTKGEIAEVFAGALEDFAGLASGATLLSTDLTVTIMATLEDVSPAAMGPLAAAVVPALGADEIARLRANIETVMVSQRRVNAGWRAALHALLDAQDDADAYAATFSASERVLPPIGARIARRFLKAGRLDAADEALARSNPFDAGGGRTPSAGGDPGRTAWEGAWIDLLEAKGEVEAAQSARWEAFERDLDARRLRDYLRRLTGFDDVVATDKALDYAAGFKPFATALAFLLAWPAPQEAARMVVARAAEIDGGAIEIVEPAARSLEDRYPLAATLLLRAMVRHVARHAQAELYGRAHGWLKEAASLAARVADFEGHEDQAAFEGRYAAVARP